MTGDEKKKRDPIFSACFVIFILAAAGVVGVFVDEHYLTEDTTKAAYGDTVEVKYVGTFYDYYGEEHAVVFDTNMGSVINGDALKSNGFSSTSTSALEFEVGGDDVLVPFGNAVVGHKVGDKIQVSIDNTLDGYPAGSASTTTSMNGLTMQMVQTMTKQQFESVYDYDLSNGSSVVFTTVYGWNATAYADSTSNSVVITHMPVAGETYTYANGDDEDADRFGTVTFEVNSTTNGVISYDIAIADYTTVDSSTGEIQMIELDFGIETWNVTNIDGTEFTYKTCGETNNQTLYFEIEIVSIN